LKQMKATERLLINFAHSPDSDDAFMYYGIASGAVGTGDFAFKQVMKDIQTLNEEAKEGKYEISAVSFAAYPHIKSQYLLMPCGASFGIECGPIVVVNEKQNVDLNSITVAVPGYMTTAYLLLRLAMPEAKVIMLPFDEIVPAVQNGLVEAGLIIHEGQLTHQRSGLKKIFDLGEWWYEKTKLPLPLGANVIRRDLGEERILQLTQILKSSVVYSLQNRAAAMKYALGFARGMSEKIADEYIKMYVNDLSIDCGEVGRLAVKELFDLAVGANLCSDEFQAEFVS
jgi:1,4-dihydroxy-6-naphthoate synthase